MTTVQFDKTAQPGDVLDGMVIGPDPDPGTLPDVLPPWVTDWEILRVRAELRARRARRLALYHAVRSPLHGARLVVRGTVGTARGVRLLADWIRHAEAAPLRRNAVATLDRQGYVQLHQIQREHVKVRGIIVGSTALAVAGGVVWQLAALPDVVVYAEGALAWAVAAWHGGPAAEDDDSGVFGQGQEWEALDPGMSPKTFGKMLREALEEDLGIPVADVHVTGQTWGFEAVVQLDGAKPADVTAKLDDLEAHLVARPGSLLVQQSAKARPVFTLRALSEDPWAGQPDLPYRAPKSATVHEQATLGMSLTRAPLELRFLRTNAVLIGGPGSGKSNAELAMAEYLTACRDAVVWYIDLGSAGAGLDPLAEAISRRATNPEDARRLLEDALAISVSRPNLFRRLRMGRDWQPSPTHPALILIIDEYPALVAAGLFDIVAEIIRTGRKSAVNVILAAQGATKSFLGSADPAAVQTRIALSCRSADVTQLLGGGALGEGWAAHRLRPAEGDVLNDVSVAYIRGGGNIEPIPQRFGYLTDDDLERRAAERRAAGLVQLDTDSLQEAGVDLSVPLTGTTGTYPGRVDTDTEPPAVLVASIAILQNAEVPVMTPADLLIALKDSDSGEFGHLTPVTLGRALADLGAGARSWGKARGVYLADLAEAAEEYRQTVPSG